MMESKPIKTIRLHDYLRSKLCDLYENDSIFDKFECNFGPNGQHAVTGGYNNMFQIYELGGKGNKQILEATKSNPNKLNKKKGSKKRGEDINPDTVDFNKKLLHVAWHPRDNLLAVGASNNMFIFQGDAVKPQ